MATVGTLAINVVARTGGFQKGLGGAAKSVRGFQSTVGGAVGTVGKFIPAIAGIATVSGLVVGGIAKINQAFGDMDRIGKFSDEVGIATEKLVGYEHAASQTGTSVEALNKGLQRMVRRIGEARAGYGEGLKGIEQLGMTSAQLSHMDMATAFETVAEKIKLIEDPAKRAAAAYSLFGRQGQDLMNLLMAGKDGIREYLDEAEKLGITFSRDEAAKVEAYNDAVDEMKKAFMGLARDLAPVVADVLIPFVRWVTEGVVKFVEFLNVFRRAAGHIKESLGGFVHLLPGGAVMDLFGDTTAGLKTTSTAAKEAAQATKQVAGATRQATPAIRNQADAVQQLAQSYDQVAASADKAAAATAKGGGGAQAGGDQEIEHAGGRVTRLRRKTSTQAAQESKVDREFREQTKKMVAALQAQLKKQDQLITAQTETAEELNEWRVQWGLEPKLEVYEVSF